MPPILKKCVKAGFLLIVLLVGIYYIRLFGPVRTISALPTNEDALIFNTQIFTSPLTSERRLFVHTLESRRFLRWKFTDEPLGYSSHISWSADKQQLFFDGGLDTEAGSGLYWINKSGAVTEIIRDEEFPGSIQAVLSPDGSSIVVVLETNELYVLDMESGERSRLTNNNRIEREPSWSPDGTELVFWMSSTETEPGGIYRIKKDGTGLRPVFTSGVSFMPRWSPDGERIAFAYKEHDEDAGSALWVMTSDGSMARELVPASTATDRVVDMTWSPDSTHIALVSTRDSYCGLYVEYAPTCSHSIYLVDTSTGTIERLTTRWLVVTGIAWFH